MVTVNYLTFNLPSSQTTMNSISLWLKEVGFRLQNYQIKVIDEILYIRQHDSGINPLKGFVAK